MPVDRDAREPLTDVAATLNIRHMDVKPILLRPHRSIGSLILACVLVMLLPAGAAVATRPVQAAFTAPLRDVDKPGLKVRQVATIESARHRMIFYQATWDGGETYVRDLFVRTPKGWLPVTDPAQRFAE